jgi:D-aminopeptidase
LQVVTLSNSKRPPEYLRAIEELKKSFVKSIEIVNRLRNFGLKYGLSKDEIRKDIELALEGVVKPRQLRSLLPLELKNVNKIRVQAKKEVAADAAAKHPEPTIEFRGKISRMGNRRVI